MRGTSLLGKRVLIVGAGVAGSYLYRLLVNEGGHVAICDNGQGRAQCGVRPCGFMVGGRFRDLVKLAGLKPGEYISSQYRCAVLDDVKVRGDILAVDKPRLLKALLKDADVLPAIPHLDYDLIVDATGVARALGTPIPDDLIGNTYQVRVRVQDPIEYPMFRFHNRVGYRWIIPLSDTEVHVGCGAVLMDSHELESYVDRLLAENIGGHQVICSCNSEIRVTGPVFGPFLVEGNVVHIGEAAGLVGPTTGAGNVPAMMSAALLADSITTYASRVQGVFSPMVAEAKLLRRVVEGSAPRLTDVFVWRAAWSRVGISPTLFESIKIIGGLKRTLSSANDVKGRGRRHT